MTVTQLRDSIKFNNRQIYIPLLGQFRFDNSMSVNEFWNNLYISIYNEGRDAGIEEQKNRIKKELGL
jgi:hypothetical protein